jgi:predicted NBD/HSP70 family sugar kinase
MAKPRASGPAKAAGTVKTAVAKTGKSGAHFKPRGSNQMGMRQFNERVVLHAIRLHGAQPKADLARLTHLSSQSVSLIIDRLLADELVTKQEPVRGKVGQPSVPIDLNPDGAFSIGIKLGRRNCDTLLVDFTGAVRARASLAYDFPDPDAVFDFIAAQLVALPKTLGKALASRVYGVGIAAPLSLEGWQSLLDVESQRSARWAHINMQQKLQAMTTLPVSFVKDTAAACVAELVSGRGRSVPSYLYLFVDTFIGGGLVIDSHLHAGLHGNAGAVASMSLHVGKPQVTQKAIAAGTATVPQQLLSLASLVLLERRYRAAHLDPAACYDLRALTEPWVHHSQLWIDEAAPAIALAVHNATCLLDMDAVVLDGSLGRELLGRLVKAVNAALVGYNWEGITAPHIYIGTIGADARAMGGALLPLYHHFAPDQDLFLKVDR